MLFVTSDSVVYKAFYPQVLISLMRFLLFTMIVEHFVPLKQLIKSTICAHLLFIYIKRCLESRKGLYHQQQVALDKTLAIKWFSPFVWFVWETLSVRCFVCEEEEIRKKQNKEIQVCNDCSPSLWSTVDKEAKLRDPSSFVGCHLLFVTVQS